MILQENKPSDRTKDCLLLKTDVITHSCHCIELIYVVFRPTGRTLVFFLFLRGEKKISMNDREGTICINRRSRGCEESQWTKTRLNNEPKPFKGHLKDNKGLIFQLGGRPSIRFHLVYVTYTHRHTHRGIKVGAANRIDSIGRSRSYRI